MPEHYTEPVTAVYSCMAGTNQLHAVLHCKGTIGEHVSCGMYEQRSSSCKEVQIADDQCNKARRAHNMIPFVQLKRALQSTMKVLIWCYSVKAESRLCFLVLNIK